jgi:Fe2+ or Zn2+ uptake regulation protein
MYDSGQDPIRGNPLPHAIYCTSCGRLADLDVMLPELARMTGTEVSGFLITGHSVTLHGVCMTCRTRS